MNVRIAGHSGQLRKISMHGSRASCTSDISMVARICQKEDTDSSREECDQRIMCIVRQALYNGTGKGNWGLERVQGATH